MIAKEFVNHFQNFPGKEQPVDDLDSVGDIFTKKLPNEEAMKMIREVTDLEIKEAMFDIDDNREAGPDGYSSSFVKKAWSIVGVMYAVQLESFFQNGKLLGEINATLITLSLMKRKLLITGQLHVVMLFTNALVKFLLKGSRATWTSLLILTKVHLSHVEISMII